MPSPRRSRQPVDSAPPKRPPGHPIFAASITSKTTFSSSPTNVQAIADATKPWPLRQCTRSDNKFAALANEPDASTSRDDTSASGAEAKSSATDMASVNARSTCDKSRSRVSSDRYWNDSGSTSIDDMPSFKAPPTWPSLPAPSKPLQARPTREIIPLGDSIHSGDAQPRAEALRHELTELLGSDVDINGLMTAVVGA